MLGLLCVIRHTTGVRINTQFLDTIKGARLKKRLYPAVLERGPKGTFGAWFPDFPGCVAGGKSQEHAIERAENTLAQTVDALFEHDRPLPEPTPIERIVLPKGCDLLAFFIVGVDPPDPSERVNVYLPKSLIGRVDRRAADLGMSRSSFFGLAVTTALTNFPGSFRSDFAGPRSRVHQTGAVRERKPPAKKPR
jgi:predicted RNase H-like HicB family nuclease